MGGRERYRYGPGPSCAVAVDGGGPGNRNDPVHYRGSPIEELCRTHGRVLVDGGYRVRGGGLTERLPA